MRNFSILALISIILLSSCDDDTTNPDKTINLNGYKLYEVYYDDDSQSWKDDSNYAGYIAMDFNYPELKSQYLDYYGKNRYKGDIREKFGMILEKFIHGPDPCVYFYDSDKRLIKKEDYDTYKGSSIEYFVNKNGKLLYSYQEFSDDDNPTLYTTYEYGDNNYVSVETHYKISSANDTTIDYKLEYTYNSDGFLTQAKRNIWYSNDTTYFTDYVYYTYNSKGLLIEERTENGYSIGHEYNNINMVEKIFNDDELWESYTYNESGRPIERISYRNGEPFSKTIIEYY